MADLQDIVKQIEEERKKAAEEELKQRQNVKEQQKKDAKILSDAQKGLVKEKIEQQKKEKQKQEELRKAQEKFAEQRESFESETNSILKRELGFRAESAKENLETAQDAHKKESTLLQEKITGLKENANIVKQAIAKQKEVHSEEVKNLDNEKKKQDEIQKKKDLIKALEKTHLNGIQKTLLGANKALTGLGDTIKGAFGETSIGKVWSFGKDLLGKGEDTDVEFQKKELAKLEGKPTKEPEQEQKASKLLSWMPLLGMKDIVAKDTTREKLLLKPEHGGIEPDNGDTTQKVEVVQESENTPQKVEIVAQPQPEKDKFAEEKANEAAHIQSDQAETQERMADALEKQQEDQSVKVEGKDTGIFGKILGGKFNPLKALQGMVSGIFGIIEEFIKGIGNVLKAALGVVEKLVKGIGEILLSIVDIIGKGFVKLMTFAGQGIAALFKALGSIPPQALLIGAAAIGVLTLAFMGLGKGLQMMTPAIKELATIPFDNFLSLAGGLLVLTPALIAFGIGSVIATPGFFGLALGVGALGLALRVLAPAIETIIPPITDMVGGLGDFITTVGTAMSNFITSFAQSLVLLGDADFGHLALGFGALGVALAAFGGTAWVAIPSLIALGKASSGLADLIDVPPDRFDALRESFKLLGKAVKGFASDAKGLGGTVLAMGALSAIPFANKLLKVQLAKTETRDVIDNFRGGVAEAIQPVDIVSFSGARTERSVEMLRQASETAEIRDETAMNASGANVVTTAVTDASSVTNNAIVVQDSPTNSSFRASVGTYGP